ncbi:MAG: ATP synthase F1 subunit epsilon [Rhodothermales bacterium]|nr:ATP synthase F1 subunit epsilon [Rhodothermales bacterium]
MAGKIFVDIVSPNGSVFQGEATGIRAPGTEGSFEVLYNHAPMLAAFDIGPIYVTVTDGSKIVFATSGGFLEVLDNRVTVLAETAEPASGIDVERAKESEKKALAALQAASPEERTKAEVALERARNRARVALSSVGSKRSS